VGVTPSSLGVALVSRANAREAVVDARASGADLICLPHLSFAPYIAAERDRAGLELAERPPARSWRDALEAAGGAWLAASAYESEGEGVFYVTALLARTGDNEPLAAYRQWSVEAEHGRYEQMFWSPGHWPAAVADAPWGATGLLVGYDLRVPDAWAAVVERGARVVIGGASEPPELWERTQRVAAGMAAAHGLTVLIANRDTDGAAFGPGGAALAPGVGGLYEIPVEQEAV
jgi:predicted amidohydrolase